MTFITTSKSQQALELHIEMKRQAECKHSFEITHKQRTDILYAWHYCKRKLFPMNTFLQFEFEFDPTDQLDNAKKVRAVAHSVLCFLGRNGKIPSHVIWSRFVAPNSNKELCSLICHVPEKLYEEFKGYACKWHGLTIDVNQCSYDKEWDVGTGELVTVFDIVMKATSKSTQLKLPGVYSEDSDVVFRPRVFCSEKLDKEEMLKEIKVQSILKSSEDLQYRLDQQKFSQ